MYHCTSLISKDIFKDIPLSYLMKVKVSHVHFHLSPFVPKMSFYSQLRGRGVHFWNLALFFDISFIVGTQQVLSWSPQDLGPCIVLVTFIIPGS